MLQNVLINMIVMIKEIIKERYTRRKVSTRITSSLRKMSLMRMNLYSSKRNQMRKVTMMKSKKRYSWHSQMMMTQG